MPSLRHRLSILLFLVAIVLGMPQPVAAHAELERADPAPDTVAPTSPPALQLWMTETIEPAFAEVVVVDPQRRPVHTTRAQVAADRLALTLPLPPLPEGIYTVTWKVTSTVDGHTTRGFYSLTVGQAAPAGAADPAPAGPPVSFEALVRWLAFAGQSLLVGGLLFGPLVLTPALVTAAIGAGSEPVARARRGRLRLHVAGLAALALAAAAALLLQALSVAGDATPTALGTTLPQLLASRYGLLWGGRVLLLVLLGALLFWRARQPAPPAWADWLGIGLGLALLLTTSLGSHAAASREGAELATAADWLHLVATSAWVGGLAQLALVMPAVAAACTPAERARLLGSLVGRFSLLSLAAVVLLIATGLYSANLHVGPPEALLTTDYGRALTAKLALLLPMLVLGALNLLRVRPALARASAATGVLAASLAAATGRAGRALAGAVRIELALGLLILAASGLLTSLPPGRQAGSPTGGSPNGLLATEQVGDLRLTLRITPAQPGENTVELMIARGGQPVAEIDRALLRLAFLDQEVGESEIVLAPAGGGRYTARGRQLGVVGRWQAEIIVRRAGQEDARTAVRFSIPAGRGAAGSPAAAPSMTITPLGWGALALLAAAGLLIAGGLRRRRSPTFGPLLGIGCGSLALAAYLLASSGLQPTGAPLGEGRNPYPPTVQSLAAGRSLYTAHCQACHGAGGKGDGPQAARLTTTPADLTTHVSQHLDAELYRMISQGVRGTAMPPFAGRLSEEERWHLINYIRTLDAYRQAGQSPPSRQP